MRTPPRLAVLAALALAAAPLRAQSDDARNAISLQPIGVLYNIFSADYERLVGGGMSLGVGGSWYARGRPSLLWNQDFQTGRRALAVDLKWRYYLADTSFSGVALVVQAGSYGEREYARGDDANRLLWRHSPTVGLGFEYTSRSRGSGATTVTLGLGAKRALGDRDSWSLPTGALMARLAIGGLF